MDCNHARKEMAGEIEALKAERYFYREKIFALAPFYIKEFELDKANKRSGG
jgi:hypothetical protein